MKNEQLLYEIIKGKFQKLRLCLQALALLTLRSKVGRLRCLSAKNAPIEKICYVFLPFTLLRRAWKAKACASLRIALVQKIYFFEPYLKKRNIFF